MEELRARVCLAFEARWKVRGARVRVGRPVGGGWRAFEEDTLAEVYAGRVLEQAWGIGEEGALRGLLRRLDGS